MRTHLFFELRAVMGHRCVHLAPSRQASEDWTTIVSRGAGAVRRRVNDPSARIMAALGIDHAGPKEENP